MSDRHVEHEERDDALAALLEPWLPARRWFPVKGTAAEVTAVGGTTLADPAGEADVRVLLLRVQAGDTRTVLQVPLVLRSSAVQDAGPDTIPGAPDARIGTLPDGTEVRDGAGDPAFVRAWLAAADISPGTPVTPERLGPPKVVPGEQSNTSVILPGAGPGGSTAMLKVFRGLSAGDNPDVDVPRALAGIGWTHVPRPLAWMSAAWPEDDGVARGHLEVLSAFVPGAQDGFELACAMAREDRPFDDLADELGAVVGQMHRALADALPAGDGSDGAAVGDPGAVADALTQRFAWASGIVPELGAHADAVADLASRTRGLSALPAAQRVHGDLHLGQVLRGDGTWYVLDFEGEPLRPVSERTRPDLALRDAAGMLRSFDYAAAVGEAPDTWTQGARDAFLRGYAAESPQIAPETAAHLLRVLELDKALYEAVYEARNRPAWKPIPLRAVERLLG